MAVVGEGIGDAVDVGKDGIVVGCGVYVAVDDRMTCSEVVGTGKLPELLVTVTVIVAVGEMVGVQLTNTRKLIMNKEWPWICFVLNRFTHCMITAS